MGFGPAGHAARSDGGAVQSHGGRGGAGRVARGGGGRRAIAVRWFGRGRAAGRASAARGFPAALRAATSAIAVYDGRETAPAGASPTMFLGADGKPIGMLGAVLSGISVGVPGAVAMLELAHKEHGKLAWRELFQPAIDTARDGFAVPPRLAGWLLRMPTDDPDIRRSTSTRWLAQEAGRADRQPGAGRDHAPDRRAGCARLLRRRYRARDGGAGAQACAAGHAVAAISPTTSRSSASRCAVLSRGIVCGMPPPSSGGIAVRRCWACSNRSSCGATSPTTCARSISSPRQAGSLRRPQRYSRRSGVRPGACRRLLSPAYLTERRKLISPDRSMGCRRPGRAAGYVERGTSHHHRSIAGAMPWPSPPPSRPRSARASW